MIRRLSLLFTLFLGLSATVSALPVSSYATSSRLSSGHWVKIRTDKEAIYQLTYDQLRGLGFQDPTKVQVYGYGSLTLADNQFYVNPTGSDKTIYPDDLQSVATKHTEDGRILFYGEGDVRVACNKVNISPSSSTYTYKRSSGDTASYYFLSDALGASQMTTLAPVSLSPGSYVTSSHLHIDLQEEELLSPNGGGSVFHWKKFSRGDSPVYTFHVKNFSPVEDDSRFANGSFAYVFGAYCKNGLVLSSEARDNVEAVPTSGTLNYGFSAMSGPTESYRNATGYLPFKLAGNVNDGNAEVSFAVNVPTSASGDQGGFYCAADRVYLNYPRANEFDAEDPYLVMNLMEGRNYTGHAVRFNGTDDKKINLWNIDTPWSVTAYTPQYDATTRQTTFVLPRKAYRVVAFNMDYTFPTPEVDGPVASQDLHAMPVPDMLIITTAELHSYAEQLANLHRTYQGMDVAVIDHDIIYNEFSSGARSSMAYRRFAKMFYDRDPEKFKYLMFFGPAAYDNRCIIFSKADRMVCHTQPDPDQCANSLLNYSIDAFFGMMNDKYQYNALEREEVQVAVGRVPALNETQAATYVSKVARRLANPLPAEVYASTLLMSGYGDNNVHAQHQEQVRDTMTYFNPALKHNYIPYEIYPKDSGAQTLLMSDAFTRGVGYMSYSGHGDPTSIVNLSGADVKAMKYDYPPFVMISSCDQFAFDRIHGGLVESMLFEPDGGALGGVAASRSVYISYNQYTCVPVAVAYAQAGPGATFGDIFKNARNSFLKQYNSGEVNFSAPYIILRNNLSYNLAGDPALPIGVPDRKIVLSKIGNSLASSGPVAQVAPFCPTTLTGSVCLSNGLIDSNFNGTVKLDIFDGDYEAYTKKHSSGDTAFKTDTITVKSNVLTTVEGKVTKGKFSVEVSVPVPTYPAGENRILMAANSDKGVSAVGSCYRIKITDYNPSLADTDFEAPVIKQIYLADADLNPTSEISGSGYVCAEIDPTAEGLNFRMGAVASSPRLVLDGLNPTKAMSIYFQRQENGDYLMKYPISNISEGAHTLELTVVSNSGLADNASIDFNVVTRAIEAVLDVEEQTASTVATIGYDGPAPEESRLVITDATGATVLSRKNPAFPYKWNLTAADGKPVADGVYKASVLVKKGRDYGHSATTQIVVLR